MMKALEKDIQIPVNNITLPGTLTLPEKAKGLVIFAHGAGSSRLSPRNTYVAALLREQTLATLLFDLLTEEEDETYENRFNIKLITQRLITATKWTIKQEACRGLNIGYFGSSTGAAAALNAAAQLKSIKAVVSRGGRPDLSKNLNKVEAATLLIVGSLDDQVISLNKEAYEQLRCEKKLTIIKGAGHLFEEPGKLEEVTGLTSHWFLAHLPKKRPTKRQNEN